MGNNLSRRNKVELANLFLSRPFSIYEFEKVSGLSSIAILKIFHEDLYEINKKKADEVNRVLDEKECLTHRGYMRELVETV